MSLNHDHGILLYPASSHPELAEGICQHLGIQMSQVQHKQFANSEQYVRYTESVRGKSVFLLASPHGNVDRELMELLIMIDAAKRGSARSITAIIPSFPYVRQDKKSSGREPITARLVATMLEGAGVNRVVSMDLHAGQVQGFFQVPMDHMTAMPTLAEYFHSQGLCGDKIVVVSPDAGRVKLARRFADRLGSPLAVLTKERSAHNQAEIGHVIGDVTGKTVLMVDDMIDTAGTLCAGAQALKEAGALSVYAAATHAIFSGPALQRIDNSSLSQVIVTDTVPVFESGKVKVLSVAPILAQVVENMYRGGSVSEVFQGENFRF
jgi:ribose-phosphate pyrophosphokinase